MANEVLFEVMASVASYGGVFTTLELQKTSRRSSTALGRAPVLREARETLQMSVSGAGPDLNIAAWAWGLGAWWDGRWIHGSMNPWIQSPVKWGLGLVFGTEDFLFLD